MKVEACYRKKKKKPKAIHPISQIPSLSLCVVHHSSVSSSRHVLFVYIAPSLSCLSYLMWAPVLYSLLLFILLFIYFLIFLYALRSLVIASEISKQDLCLSYFDKLSPPPASASYIPVQHPSIQLYKVPCTPYRHDEYILTVGIMISFFGCII